jgi:hypothetical protein
MAKGKGTALRLAISIRTLGEDPVSTHVCSYKEYIPALLEQYSRLRKELGPEAARQARIQVRKSIRELGLTAATGPLPLAQPSSISIPRPRSLKRSRQRLASFFALHKHEVPPCWVCKMHCGLPKKSWPSRDMAEESVRRNPESATLCVYECRNSPGFWHVGHRRGYRAAPKAGNSCAVDIALLPQSES